MKLSKFAKTVKESGHCMIYIMDDNSMWLGNGFGIYKAEGLPTIERADQLTAILDIEKEKARSISFLRAGHTEYKGPSIAEWDPTEVTAEKIKMLAVTDSGAFSCVKAGGELLFYNDWYLTPLADVIKNSEYLQFTVRTDPSGQRWLTVKDGMIVVGMILPVRLISEEYIDHLHEFLGECQEQLEREKARETLKGDED